MDDEWEHLSGHDVNEEEVVVSPYGKTLNAYELIVTTPGLEGWGDYVRQHSYAVHGSCGQMISSKELVARRCCSDGCKQALPTPYATAEILPAVGVFLATSPGPAISAFFSWYELLVWLRRHPKVRPELPVPLRKLLCDLGRVGDRRHDDDLVPVVPIGGRCNLVAIG